MAGRRWLLPLGLWTLGLAIAIVAVATEGEPDRAGRRGAAASPPEVKLPRGRKPLVFDAGRYALVPPEREFVLDRIDALGADTVRAVLSWQDVAPSRLPRRFDPADPTDVAYDFSLYDAYFSEVEDRGLRLLVSISGPFPEWASKSGESNVSDPRPGAFRDFVRAVGRRYSGDFDPDGAGPDGTLPGADLWSIWNEPNQSLFLEPQFVDGSPYSPFLYRRLYLVAQNALEREDPGAPVLIGETAPTGGVDAIDPIPFLQEVLCLDASYEPILGCPGGRIETAGWAHHPYLILDQAPFEAPDVSGQVTTGSLGDLAEALDLAAEAEAIATTGPRGEVAREAPPIWITEFGVQSLPDPFIGVPVQRQAEYMGLAERLAYEHPEVVSFSQYLLRDDPPQVIGGSTYAGFESGLVYYSGRTKPAYDAFRLPLSVRRVGSDVGIWGLVRSSLEATEVAIRYQDAGEAPTSLRRVRTDPAGIFTSSAEHEPGRLWQVTWRSPGGRVFRSPWVQAYAFDLPEAE